MRKVWIGLGVAAGLFAVGLGTAWLMRENLA
jgi:ribonuclease Z